MSFKSYVMSKSIYEIGESNYTFSINKQFNYEFICEHINLIFDIHERLKGCSIPKQNLINKMVEDFKVSEKILKEDLYKYQYNFKNEFEENVLKFGELILNRIQKILDVIHKSNYENLVLRSIKFREFCVYNTYLNDIFSDKNCKIFIKSIDDICENMVEYDYVKFFTRLKRNNCDLDFLKCCAYVCGKERLEMDSYNLILACISFPYEFVRVISKYRDLGGDLSNYFKKIDFKNVLKKDGDSYV